MRINKVLENIILAGAIVLGSANIGKAALIEAPNPAVNVLGYNGFGTSGTGEGKTKSITYISPDGKFMLCDSDYGISSRTFDDNANSWSSPINLVPNVRDGYLSPDGSEMYFDRNDSSGIHQIRKVNGAWDLSTDKIIATNAEHPSFNGKQLYFSTGQNGWKVGVMDYNPATDAFENRRQLPAPINLGQINIQPQVSLDGKLLFFASNRDGQGFVQLDTNIFYATRGDTSSDNWTNITNLGSNINLPNTEEAIPRVAESFESSASNPYLLVYTRRDISNNITYLQAELTPEPSSLAVLVAGGAGLLFKRKK